MIMLKNKDSSVCSIIKTKTNLYGLKYGLYIFLSEMDTFIYFY